MWAQGMLGPTGDNRGILAFWKHNKTLPWIAKHPVTKLADEDLARTIPVGMHFDDVADVKTDKTTVIQWNSCLARATS